MLVASERSRPMMTRDTTQGVDIDVAQLHLRSFDAGLFVAPTGIEPAVPQTCLIRVNEHECGGTHLASTMDRTTQGVVMCTHRRLRRSAVSGGREADRTCPLLVLAERVTGKFIDSGPRFNADLVQVARLLAISRVVLRSLACAPCGSSSCFTKFDHGKFSPPARPPAPMAAAHASPTPQNDAARAAVSRLTEDLQTVFIHFEVPSTGTPKGTSPATNTTSMKIPRSLASFAWGKQPNRMMKAHDILAQHSDVQAKDIITAPVRLALSKRSTKHTQGADAPRTSKAATPLLARVRSPYVGVAI